MTPAETLKRAQAKAARETLESNLAQQLRACRVAHEREFTLPGRAFRWDFAFPDARLLVEVQGGIWQKGAHSSGAGVTRDCEKAAFAAAHGWRSFGVTGKHIASGKALQMIHEALKVAACP